MVYAVWHLELILPSHGSINCIIHPYKHFGLKHVWFLGGLDILGSVLKKLKAEYILHLGKHHIHMLFMCYFFSRSPLRLTVPKAKAAVCRLCFDSLRQLVEQAS